MASGATRSEQGLFDYDCWASLETGDHLSQVEFHARYASMPQDVKAELIGGIVYMQSSLKRSHGRAHGLLMHWLASYEDETTGVEAYDNATMIMSPESEPQPDACFIILPDRGGQTRFTADDCLMGAPEFVGEIASSSESIDLYAKKQDYLAAGVREYLVVALRPRQVYWFANRNGCFEELPLESDGNYHSRVLPGLWLDPGAFIALDGKRLLRALQAGLASVEHSEFAHQLSRPIPPA